jgi:hypothetical protein
MNFTKIETPEQSALAVGCFFLYQEVKTSCTSTHTKNCPNGVTELRDQDRKPILSFRQKRLVKKVHSLFKESQSELDDSNSVKSIVRSVSRGDFGGKEDQRLLVNVLLDFTEARYIRPWKINDDHDSIIDASGKVFLTLPDPGAGLTTRHLEEFIIFRQEETPAIFAPNYEKTTF